MTRLLPLRRFSVAGLSVALRADDPLAARDLLARLARLAPAPPGRPALRYDLLLRPARKRVVRDGRSHYAGRAARDVVDALEFDLLVALAERAEATPLHAACLALDERAALLVGPSGSGKSTLARALLARGARYLGDEHAFLDDDLRARGLPRAIAVEPASGQPAAPALLPPPGAVEHAALPVGAVVLLSAPRRPDADPVPLAPGEAAARLLAAIYRPPRPEDLRRVTRLAAAVPVRALACEGAAAAAARVAALLSP